MRYINTISVLFLVFLFASTGSFADVDYKQSALSWQKNARDTREQVLAVAKELEQIGDKGNPAVKDLIADAKMWLKKGDDTLSQGDKLFEEGEFKRASTTYNMAWQYYVKAATAGLNARRILTGK